MATKKSGGMSDREKRSVMSGMRAMERAAAPSVARRGIESLSRAVQGGGRRGGTATSKAVPKRVGGAKASRSGGGGKKPTEMERFYQPNRSEGRSGQAKKGRKKATSRRANRRISTKWWRIGRSPWMSDAEWQVARDAWNAFKKKVPNSQLSKWVNDTHADAFTKRKQTDPTRRNNDRGDFDFRKAGINFVMEAIRKSALNNNYNTMQHVGESMKARQKWNKQRWNPKTTRMHMKKMYYTFSFGPDGKVK